jgi:hypothetical protein
MVVLGNPPYSGHSANSSVGKDGKPNFIGKLLREYYFVDGAPLGERNPKWLQDDYVKFLRFGEWRIEKTGTAFWRSLPITAIWITRPFVECVSI